MKKAVRQFWFGVFGWSVVVLFIGIIAIQAVANLRTGRWAGGYNYQWQPLGPGIQLSFVVAFVVYVTLAVRQHFRGRGNKK